MKKYLFTKVAIVFGVVLFFTIGSMLGKLSFFIIPIFMIIGLIIDKYPDIKGSSNKEKINNDEEVRVICRELGQKLKIVNGELTINQGSYNSNGDNLQKVVIDGDLKRVIISTCNTGEIAEKIANATNGLFISKREIENSYVIKRNEDNSLQEGGESMKSEFIEQLQGEARKYNKSTYNKPITKEDLKPAVEEAMSTIKKSFSEMVRNKRIAGVEGYRKLTYFYPIPSKIIIDSENVELFSVHGKNVTEVNRAEDGISIWDKNYLNHYQVQKLITPTGTISNKVIKYVDIHYVCSLYVDMIVTECIKNDIKALFSLPDGTLITSFSFTSTSTLEVKDTNIGILCTVTF